MAALLVRDSFGINERVLKVLAAQDEDGWKKILDLWESVKFKRLDSLTEEQIASLESVEMDVQEHEQLMVYQSFTR